MTLRAIGHLVLTPPINTSPHTNTPSQYNINPLSGDIARAIGHIVHVQGLENGELALYSGRIIGASPQFGTVRVRFDDIHDDSKNHAGDDVVSVHYYAISKSCLLLHAML